MKKVIRLTESDLRRIVLRVIEESTTSANNLLGRNYTINPDGTISIANNQNKLQKIRLYTKLGDMNIIKITPTSNGYKITGGKMSKDVDSDTVKKVINFVDTGSPSVIESGSWVEPDLKLKKV
jgi:hypothetical protein